MNLKKENIIGCFDTMTQHQDFFYLQTIHGLGPRMHNGQIGGKLKLLGYQGRQWGQIFLEALIFKDGGGGGKSYLALGNPDFYKYFCIGCT